MECDVLHIKNAISYTLSYVTVFMITSSYSKPVIKNIRVMVSYILSDLASGALSNKHLRTTDLSVMTIAKLH
jgi:uncharacterized protein (DUF433 family)